MTNMLHWSQNRQHDGLRSGQGKQKSGAYTEPLMTTRKPLLVPLACAGLLASFEALPQIRANDRLQAAMLGASALLVLWWGIVTRQRTDARVEVVLRPSHYMQTITQLLIFVYWGM